MDRRELLSVLGAGAGLAALGSTAFAQDSEAKSKHEDADHAHEHHEGGHQAGQAQAGHDEHLRVIVECAGICNETARHSLEALRKGGEHSKVNAAIHEATMDCQAFCALTAALVARKSPMAGYAHGACADACRDCAAACGKGQDDLAKRCAEVCRQCEQVCRQMAKKGGKGRKNEKGKSDAPA